MKKLFLAVIVAIISTMDASAGVDKKFYQKAIDNVWQNDDSVFDSNTQIPDSLSSGNSAVIIGWRDQYDIDNIVEKAIFMPTGFTNRVKCTSVKRQMVKLFDQTAVDKFTEFEFDGNREIKISNSVLIYSEKNAFGARIFKPDGSVTVVNIPDIAVEIGKGKKGKDNSSYKVAIPGLEVGDILEYFYMTEELAETLDLDARNAIMCSKYPVLKREVFITTHPAMTVEYKTYNGVPKMLHSTNDKQRPTASLSLSNIPPVNFSRYLMDYRQLPFVRINILNNTAQKFKAKSARGGGLYGNIHTGKIYTELGDYLHDVTYESSLNGRAGKILKDYFSSKNPDATPAQVADAAWLALRYAENSSKKSGDKAESSFERALIFFDILDKLELYPTDSIGIGFINPRNDVPTAEMASWNEPRFTVNTPDGIYYMAADLTIKPRELPGVYNGETGGLFRGKRKYINTAKGIEQFTIPGNKPSDNTINIVDTVSILDDNRLGLSRHLVANGGCKQQFAPFTDNNVWCEAVEDFFDIPANKRFEDKEFDSVGRNNERLVDMRELCQKSSFIGTQPDSVSSLQFESIGVTPDKAALRFVMKCEFSDLIEPLGDDLSINIGKLMGADEAFTDNERERLLDVMLDYATQEKRQLVLKAPEGYQFDSESVQSLARNSNEVVGQFIVSPSLNAEGDLVIQAMQRFKFATIPLQYWPTVRNLIDASAAFADATVVLTRKQ